MEMINTMKTKLLELELKKLQLSKVLNKIEQQIKEIDKNINHLHKEQLI
jgi:hypothetical protein